jgi:hypothetical protein
LIKKNTLHIVSDEIVNSDNKLGMDTLTSKDKLEVLAGFTRQDMEISIIGWTSRNDDNIVYIEYY